MVSIFTKIINREIPANILYEDDKVIAFKDVAPAAKIHILFVPKKEIPTINDIQPEDEALIGYIYTRIAKVAKELGMAEKGYRVVSNCNKYGGQTVFHIHFHLLGGEQLNTMV